jgi:hypothetical protein
VRRSGEKMPSTDFTDNTDLISRSATARGDREIACLLAWPSGKSIRRLRRLENDDAETRLARTDGIPFHLAR